MYFFALVSTVFFSVLGALCGSFAAVIAERLNTGGSWLRGRSRCNTCDRVLGPLDLLPVFSWMLTRGACRMCRARIPVRYVVIELVFAFVFVLSYLKIGFSPLLALFLIEIVTIGALVLYDIRHTIVPDSLVRTALGVAILFALFSSSSVSSFGAVLLTAGIIGLGFFLLYKLSNGRAMGLGDAPVAATLTLLVGESAIPGLLFSFWIGALFGICVLVMRPKGHRMGIEVPFVPFLALGFLLAYFTGWNPLNIVLF